MSELSGNFKKAFDELKALGAPVFTVEDRAGYEQYTHECCQFVMSAEEGKEEFLNYNPVSYTKWYAGMYNDDIHNILEKYNLYGEWANPAVLCICE